MEKIERTTTILLDETLSELEQKRKAIERANAALQKSLEELKATQAQLIQSEKWLSLVSSLQVLHMNSKSAKFCK